jgi:Family of unknown function (DUF5906)
MRGDALFDFLIGRWEQADPDDRGRVFRELCSEASTAYAGDPESAQFIGRFVGAALLIFPDIKEDDRRTFLAIARKAIQESEIKVEDVEESDDVEDRALSKRELSQKRKEAKAEREAVLKEFNDRYAVVKEGGTAMVFEDCFDDVLRRQFYDRLKPNSLQLIYAGRSVCTRVDDDGKRHLQPVAKWWLNHPERKTFQNGTTFMPREQAREGFLNLWRGFGVEPKQGCWEKLRTHVSDVVCGGDKTYFTYLMGWIAHMIQFPGQRAEVAVVLRGPPRSGKGTLGHALRHLFGQHAMHISSSKHLVGNFNAHLRDCIFLFADEAFFAGDKANTSTLKAIITEEVLTIEAKYLNAVQCRNMLHTMLASNEDWVVPVSIGDERFFVLDVPATRQGDHNYFGAIKAELAAGGHEAMLYDLLRYDLAGFNIRAVPQTAALETQKHYSVGTTVAWIREIIERGYVYESKLGLDEKLHKWFDPVAVPLLYASYCVYAARRGERHPLNQGALVEFLAAHMKWKQCRPDNYDLVIGERQQGRLIEVTKNRARTRCFQTGDLATVRRAFQMATGLQVETMTGDDIPTEEAKTSNVIPF